MAIQQWTIIKLVGPAGDDAALRFERWWRARRSADPTGFSPGDWRAATRRAVADYLARLEAHRWEMPVAYFSQHIDFWLAGGQIQLHLGRVQARVYHDAGELWCYRLPDRGKLVRRNSRQMCSGQFSENQWLARRLIEAAQAYEKVWYRSALLINRKAIAPSASFEQNKAMAITMPRWIARSNST